MTVAIVDYGMGNLHSVSKAVERLGYECIVTGEAERILAADSVILPGVGAFGDAMGHLRESGLDLVVKQVAAGDQPLLGICSGCSCCLAAVKSMAATQGLIFSQARWCASNLEMAIRCHIWAGTGLPSDNRKARCLRDYKRDMCILYIPIMSLWRKRAICWESQITAIR